MLYREIIAVCSDMHMKHEHGVWEDSTVSVCERRWFVYLLLFYKRVRQTPTKQVAM